MRQLRYWEQPLELRPWESVVIMLGLAFILAMAVVLSGVDHIGLAP